MKNSMLALALTVLAALGAGSYGKGPSAISPSPTCGEPTPARPVQPVALTGMCTE